NVYDTLCSTDTFDVNVTALADDVITAGKFDESTAFPLKSADTGSTQVARVGADGDTLETLSDQLDTAQTDLDNPSQYKADVSALALKADLQDVEDKIDVIATDTTTEISATLANLALEATLTAMKGVGWTNETLVALKAYVDEIETRLTAVRAGYLDKLNVTGTLAHSDAAATYKADVSGLAPANEYDAKLSAIQADLDNPAQYRADVSALATQESVNAIPTTPLLAANYTAPDNASIAAILEDTGTAIPATLVTIDNEIAVIDGNVDAVLDDTGTSGVLLSTSALGSIFDDEVIVGTYTARDLLKIMASALAGKLSGGGTTTMTFKSVDGASDVIVASVDANGNRTSVTLTV